MISLRFPAGLLFALLVSCSPAPLVPASVSRAIDTSDARTVERYRQLAEAALADKQAFYDTRLDSISNSLHGESYDEGIRTILAGSRDRAQLYFKQHPGKAAELIRLGNSTPNPDLDPVLLATWTVIAAEVDHLSAEQRQMTEEFESR